MTDLSSDRDIVQAQLSAALVAVQRLQQQIAKIEMANDGFHRDHYRDFYQLQTHLTHAQHAFDRTSDHSRLLIYFGSRVQAPVHEDDRDGCPYR